MPDRWPAEALGCSVCGDTPGYTVAGELLFMPAAPGYSEGSAGVLYPYP